MPDTATTITPDPVEVKTTRADVVKYFLDPAHADLLEQVFPSLIYWEISLPDELYALLKGMQTHHETIAQKVKGFPFNYIGTDDMYITFIPADWWKRYSDLSHVMNSHIMGRTPPPIFPDDTYRVRIRPGKFVKKVFPTATAQECEAFASAFDVIQKKWSYTNIREDMDILRAYDGQNYIEGTGPLQKSCMRSIQCQPFMDFYRRNGLRIATFSDPDTGQTRARALLWPDVSFDLNDGQVVTATLMDRIYFTVEDDLKRMQAYAKAHGYWFKTTQSAHSPRDFTTPEGKQVQANASYPLSPDRKGYLGPFPYLDTFMFMNLEVQPFRMDNYISYGNQPSLRELGGGIESISKYVEQLKQAGLEAGQLEVQINPATYEVIGDPYGFETT